MSNVQFPSKWTTEVKGALIVGILSAIAILVGIVAKHHLGTVGGPVVLWGGVGLLAVDIIVTLIVYFLRKNKNWVVTQNEKGKVIWEQFDGKITHCPQGGFMLFSLYDSDHNEQTLRIAVNDGRGLIVYDYNDWKISQDVIISQDLIISKDLKQHFPAVMKNQISAWNDELRDAEVQLKAATQKNEETIKKINDLDDETTQLRELLKED